MIEQSVGVDDFVHIVEVVVRLFQIEKFGPHPVVARPKNLIQFGTSVGDADAAISINKKGCMIANARAQFKHRTARQRRTQRREMLLLALVVPNVVAIPKAADCLSS
jgi:hypothetical protein